MVETESVPKQQKPRSRDQKKHQVLRKKGRCKGCNLRNQRNRSPDRGQQKQKRDGAFNNGSHRLLLHSSDLEKVDTYRWCQLTNPTIFSAVTPILVLLAELSLLHHEYSQDPRVKV